MVNWSLAVPWNSRPDLEEVMPAESDALRMSTDMLMPPEGEAMFIPSVPVRYPRDNPELLPIRSIPFAAELASRPVPPLDVPRKFSAARVLSSLQYAACPDEGVPVASVKADPQTLVSIDLDSMTDPEER